MKNSWIENPNGENMLYCLLYTYKFLVLKNTNSLLLVEFQSFIFGQILANLGNFGQFWAD
jgi:hypothetical protein